LSGFLTRFSEKLRNLSDAQEEALRESFLKNLEACRSLFGVHVFRTAGSDKKKLQFIAALCDAQMIAVHELNLTDAQIKSADKKAIAKATSELLDDETFSRHISQATTNKNALLGRIKQFITHLKKLI
jgi:hypothetical protein